jgi:biopolymer transport protein ExbD
MHIFVDEFVTAHRRRIRTEVGAMKVQDENEPYDEINITPMLDLAYVLLVIFIIMTTASVQGIKVNLPKASAAPSLAKPTTKAITITAEGRIFLDTYPVTIEELEQMLRNHKAVNPISRWWSRATRACSTRR